MSSENAVKSLAILTAIPAVGFAIWADHFSRKLAALSQSNPYYDRAAEAYKVRLAGVCGIFFQFGIFMGTSPMREGGGTHSLICYALLATAILVQSSIQAGLERKLRSDSMPQLKAVRPEGARDETRIAGLRGGVDSAQDSPATEMQTALRAFFWASLGGALYLTGFAVPVVVASFAAKALGAPDSIMSGIVIVSAVLGMMAGVGINFALGAFYLRKMLPTRAMTQTTSAPTEAAGAHGSSAEAVLISRIEGCFANAGQRVPSLWSIESGRTREATAMLAGFPGGRGLFRPGLFLSRALLESLNEREILAVVNHEVAHLALRHLRKRLAYSVVLVVGTTTLATFCVLAANVLLAGSELRSFIGFGSAVGAFFLTFNQLAKQSRAHETQADLYCVEKLGAEADDLVSALRKLDQVNGRMLGAVLKTHPSTDRRAAAIEYRAAELRAAAALSASASGAKAAGADSEDQRRAA